MNNLVHLLRKVSYRIQLLAQQKELGRLTRIRIVYTINWFIFRSLFIHIQLLLNRKTRGNQLFKPAVFPCNSWLNSVWLLGFNNELTPHESTPEVNTSCISSETWQTASGVYCVE